MQIKKLIEILESKSVRPSFQRLSVLNYIIQDDDHPSVDTIYQALSKEIPTISKTTIYNTLNLFTEKGIITPLTIANHELRYDFMEEMHAHFQCIKCGNIYDVELEDGICEKEFVNGHKVTQTQIHYKGICENCLNKDKE